VSQTLDDRVAKLERQNRRLGAAVLVVVVLLAVVLVRRGQPSPPAGEVVRAQQFVVVDALGRTRAMLGLDHPLAPDHSPVRLALYNEAQRSSAILYLADAFAGLTIKTGAGEGERSTNLFANPSEGAGIGLGTGLRRSAVRITADTAAAPGLVLQNPAGAVVFKAP
jgi:hypothetical protein